jgi:hypothetical protein
MVMEDVDDRFKGGRHGVVVVVVKIFQIQGRMIPTR